MPKPTLAAPYDKLESDMIETMIAGLKVYRPDLKYPESASDMAGCARALMRMFVIKRRPLALDRLPLEDDSEGKGNG